MERTGLAARMGDRDCVHRDLWGDLSERVHLEDLDVDGRTILKWILEK
jgi:hypothetical protein